MTKKPTTESSKPFTRTCNGCEKTFKTHDFKQYDCDDCEQLDRTL